MMVGKNEDCPQVVFGQVVPVKSLHIRRAW